MILDQEIYDQTNFGSEEPLLEPVLKVEPEKPQTKAAPKKPKLSKKKKGLIIIAVGVVLLLLFIPVSLLILNQTDGNGVTAPEVSPSPQASVTQEDELTERLKDLKLELQEADPTVNDLPFPQVDMELGASQRN